jgi:hypothetical protein
MATSTCSVMDDYKRCKVQTGKTKKSIYKYISFISNIIFYLVFAKELCMFTRISEHYTIRINTACPGIMLQFVVLSSSI